MPSPKVKVRVLGTDASGLERGGWEGQRSAAWCGGRGRGEAVAITQGTSCWELNPLLHQCLGRVDRLTRWRPGPGGVGGERGARGM